MLEEDLPSARGGRGSRAVLPALPGQQMEFRRPHPRRGGWLGFHCGVLWCGERRTERVAPRNAPDLVLGGGQDRGGGLRARFQCADCLFFWDGGNRRLPRSEEHTSELQS